MHKHSWGQFVYAASGVLFVRTEAGSYIVPPSRGVWMPEGIVHCSDTPGGAEMRSLYFHTEHTGGMPDRCRVLDVSPLLRELILEAAELETFYDWHGKDGRLMRVIRDQVGQMNEVPLYLPLPRHPKLQKITEQLLDDPADNRSIEQWGADVGGSGRTLARLYLKETGMSFGNWRQLFRIQAALQLLAEGEPVTTVAFDVGYNSVSAFIAMFRKQMGYSPGGKGNRLTTASDPIL